MFIDTVLLVPYAPYAGKILFIHWSINKRIKSSLQSIFSLSPYLSCPKEQWLNHFLKYSLIFYYFSNIFTSPYCQPNETQAPLPDTNTRSSTVKKQVSSLSPISHCPFLHHLWSSNIGFCASVINFTLCYCWCCFFHPENLPRPQCLNITVSFTYGKAE